MERFARSAQNSHFFLARGAEAETVARTTVAHRPHRPAGQPVAAPPLLQRAVGRPPAAPCREAHVAGGGIDLRRAHEGAGEQPGDGRAMRVVGAQGGERGAKRVPDHVRDAGSALDSGDVGATDLVTDPEMKEELPGGRSRKGPSAAREKVAVVEAHEQSSEKMLRFSAEHCGGTPASVFRGTTYGQRGDRARLAAELLAPSPTVYARW